MPCAAVAGLPPSLLPWHRARAAAAAPRPLPHTELQYRIPLELAGDSVPAPRLLEATGRMRASPQGQPCERESETPGRPTCGRGTRDLRRPRPSVSMAEEAHPPPPARPTCQRRAPPCQPPPMRFCARGNADADLSPSPRLPAVDAGGNSRIGLTPAERERDYGAHHRGGQLFAQVNARLRHSRHAAGRHCLMLAGVPRARWP